MIAQPRSRRLPSWQPSCHRNPQWLEAVASNWRSTLRPSGNRTSGKSTVLWIWPKLMRKLCPKKCYFNGIIFHCHVGFLQEPVILPYHLLAVLVVNNDSDLVLEKLFRGCYYVFSYLEHFRSIRTILNGWNCGQCFMIHCGCNGSYLENRHHQSPWKAMDNHSKYWPMANNFWQMDHVS